MMFCQLILCAVLAATQPLEIRHLRCEYREGKTGVETLSPQLSWELYSERKNIVQNAYRILVGTDSVGLQTGKSDMWDSGKITSGRSIQVPYEGAPLGSGRTYYWKVIVWEKEKDSVVSPIGKWQMGLLNTSAWKSAHWIAYEELPEERKIVPAEHGKGTRAKENTRNVLPLLRKTFTINKAFKRATVFVCGLGQFEMYMNGGKVGDHFLDPAWTRYDREANYVVFDVTPQLRTGSNAVGVMLGNGFYYSPAERYRKLSGAFGWPKMIFLLQLENLDGSVQYIASDTTWKTARGPIVFSSIYGGEDYDARLEQEQWHQSGFDDRRWKSALSVAPVPELYAQSADPVKVVKVLEPVNKRVLPSGELIYDLGQNASGVPRVTVTGNPGDSVIITPGELLDKNGYVTQKHTGSPVFYTYILKGEKQETWHPRFSCYGYRYLQVRLAGKGNKKPEIDHIASLHIRNSAPETGRFSSSSPLLNNTYDLVNWAVKSNMVSIFTDCPHREKLGWLEQTYLMGSSIRYAYDIAPLFRKMLGDMRAAQTREGLIPAIAPEFTEMHFADGVFRDSPEWGSAGVILPWYMYRWYGDRSVLEENYGMMKKYMNHLRSRDTGRILTHGLSDWYDVGPERSGFSQLTPQGLTATATYYYDLTIMAEIAGVLSIQEDSVFYHNWANEVKSAFHEKFYNKEEGYYGTGSQTSNAVPLYVGLVPKEREKKVIDYIVQQIRQHDFKVTAGDIGYRYLLRVLEKYGQSQLIYEMNSRSDVPGYGFQLAKGATALTESWVASPEVSNNHLMLGHIWEWFYSGLGGLKQEGTSVLNRVFRIEPDWVNGVDSVAVEHFTPYGQLSSSWKKEKDGVLIKVIVPGNTSAELVFPKGKMMERSESGTWMELPSKKKPAEKNILQRGSGRYVFKILNN